MQKTMDKQTGLIIVPLRVTPPRPCQPALLHMQGCMDHENLLSGLNKWDSASYNSTSNCVRSALRFAPSFAEEVRLVRNVLHPFGAHMQGFQPHRSVLTSYDAHQGSTIVPGLRTLRMEMYQI